MELREVDGHAVYSVNVPAQTKDVSVAHSPIEGCAIAAVEAWNRVKGPGDASFEASVSTHRQNLINAAEAIYRGGAPSTNGTIQSAFEQEVARIKAEQDKPVVVAPPAVLVERIADEKIAPAKEVKTLPVEPPAGKVPKKHVVHPVPDHLVEEK